MELGKGRGFGDGGLQQLVIVEADDVAVVFAVDDFVGGGGGFGELVVDLELLGIGADPVGRGMEPVRLDVGLGFLDAFAVHELVEEDVNDEFVHVDPGLGPRLDGDIEEEMDGGFAVELVVAG